MGAPFYESLYAVIDPLVPCILCGDFNTVADPNRDRRGCNIFSRWAYDWSDTLTHLMDTYDLRDVWRQHHPDATAFTWHRPNSAQASRLDMFWLSAFFLPLILVVDIFPFFRSDHSYVYLKFSLPQSIHQGPGVWKFNTAHLSDLSFIVLVTQFWEMWQAEKGSFCALSAWWDAGKARLKRLNQSFSRKRASAFHRRVTSIERTLYFLQCRADAGEDVERLFSDTQAELEELLRQKATGCRLRANVQWAEEGEAPTAYFYNLERKRGDRKSVV